MNEMKEWNNQLVEFWQQALRITILQLCASVHGFSWHTCQCRLMTDMVSYGVHKHGMASGHTHLGVWPWTLTHEPLNLISSSSSSPIGCLWQISRNSLKVFPKHRLHKNGMPSGLSDLNFDHQNQISLSMTPRHMDKQTDNLKILIH